MRATRCDLCGIYFDGFAFEFHYDKTQQPHVTRTARRIAYGIIALIILGSMTFYLVLPLMR